MVLSERQQRIVARILFDVHRRRAQTPEEKKAERLAKAKSQREAEERRPIKPARYSKRDER
jgi:hypothetical protein